MRVTTAFYGEQPPGSHERGPSCRCGAVFGRARNLPHGHVRGRIACRTCAGPEHHVVYIPRQPTGRAPAREVETC